MKRVTYILFPLAAIVILLTILIVHAAAPSFMQRSEISIERSGADDQVYRGLENVRAVVLCRATDICRRVLDLLSRVGVGEVTIIDSLSKLVKRVDVIFMLSPDDADLIRKLLENGTAIVATADIYEDLVVPLLQDLRSALVVRFNGTRTYCIKIVDRLPDGRYVIAIHGIADDLSSETTIQEFARWFTKVVNLKVEKVLGFPRRLTGSIPEVRANSTPPGVDVQNVVYTAGSSQPYWATIGYVSWSSGDIWRPYGRLSIEHKVMQLINDGVANIDWFMVQCVTQAIPGAQLYGSDWKIEDFFNHYYLKYSSMHELRDYDPTSMTNPVSVSVALGEDVAVVISWTYPGNYIDWIRDESDFYTDIAGWWHNIHEASVTLKIEPGFEFTSPPITGTQRWEISVQWGRWNWPWHDLVKTTLVVYVTFQY